MNYQNKSVIIATKHEKEKVIAPAFEQQLNCRIVVPDNFDTDQFGTFTGTVTRKGTAYETVLLKAKYAASHYGYDYAIASEGSFGPHPTLHFVPGATELLVFVDLINDLVILESEITTDTNYAYCKLSTPEVDKVFLQKIKFPSHAVVVRAVDSDHIIAKGVMDESTLNQAITAAFSQSSVVQLETDMRAMCNPTRMTVIERLAAQLVERIKTHCPECNTPGFGKRSVQGFLKCRDCESETTLSRYKVLNCLKCDYKELKPRDDQLEFADPMHCPICNP